MIYSIDVRVEAPVYDTEREERVVRAVRNLFPAAEIETGGSVVATTHELDRFAERLREQRILDTARSVFRDSRTPEGFEFDLRKGPAFVGRVNFAADADDELGHIHVEVTVREPSVEAFVDYLAPETDAEGRPPAEEG